MSEVLFLSHRIPYPPDKGDKIRSWNLLKALAAKHEVHVGSFVDDPADFRHADALKQHCASLKLVARGRLSRLRYLRGLLGGTTVTEAFYGSAQLETWVRSLSEAGKLSAVVVYSSGVAQFAEPLLSSLPSVLDLCDVDSEKWAEYAAKSRSFVAWIYAREARLLKDREMHLARKFRLTTVSAERERQIMAKAGSDVSRVRIVRNGVDVDYFDPSVPLDDPFGGSSAPVVMTGAMDYRPNEDAAVWFATEVLPRILVSRPATTFWIVGARPSRAVRQLRSIPGVVVTGRVDDVRPFLAHCHIAVVPLRIARGIQNKLLEALAMGVPVVCSPQAAEGLGDIDGEPFRVAASETQFAAAVLEELAEPRRRLLASREVIMRAFRWEDAFGPVLEAIA